jgi:hypothetical protein
MCSLVLGLRSYVDTCFLYSVICVPNVLHHVFMS